MTTSPGAPVEGWHARLAKLGIRLPPVAAPVASYVPAVRTGSLVFTSGQLPFVEGGL
nr:RidA family protein [Actinomycetota bacterium]